VGVNQRQDAITPGLQDGTPYGVLS
jgi:hypothetical protein